ncbi:MAG: RNA-binding protein [Anaerolineae bacterium]
MSNRLYIGNLSYNTDDATLRQLFSQAGEVVDIHLPTDRETGRPRGFGFVEMADSSAARAAITQFDGYTLDDRQLRVNEAQEKSTGGNGGYRSGGNSRSNRY